MKLGHDVSESLAKWPSLTYDLFEELQAWATMHSLPKIPHEQLAIFAHSCYYDKDATLRCMDVYYKLRATVPEFFADRDPTSDNLRCMLKVLYFIGLPKPDKQGNRIIFHGLADTNPSRYVFNESAKLLMMSMDASLYEFGCAPGHVFLFDMRGVKLSHLTRLTLNGIKRFFDYIQEAAPVRLKAIHVVNCVWFMDKILALIKPFMKKEFFEILHIHTGDVSEVYQYIPPECLPKDFGGELDDVETLHGEHSKKLIELRDYFLEEERLYREYRSLSKKSTASWCTDAQDIGNRRDKDVGTSESS